MSVGLPRKAVAVEEVIISAMIRDNFLFFLSSDFCIWYQRSQTGHIPRVPASWQILCKSDVQLEAAGPKGHLILKGNI